MRRDHRPVWMRDAWNAYEAWWMQRFLAPQFEALGPDATMVRPWHVEVVGAGIRAGARLHILASRDAPVRLTTWPGPGDSGAITLGDAVLLTGGVRILAAKDIAIGAGCMLAHAATLTDCDWHGLYDRVGPAPTHPVRLGANVWVGDGAYIGKGVTVGDNAVIAARSAVVKDVEAYTVVAGVPARVVKRLDPRKPMRTRMDFFASAEADTVFEKAWRARHGRNTFLAWLRTKIAPRADD